jgi:replicative DNA helicase
MSIAEDRAQSAPEPPFDAWGDGPAAFEPGADQRRAPNDRTPPQDMAAEQSVLGAADLAVIAMRRRLLEAVQALAERDETPYEALDGDTYRIRPASVVLPRTTPWDEGAAEALLARV